MHLLTFANHETALVGRHCVRHLLQAAGPPHVAVPSASASHDASKAVALLRQSERAKFQLEMPNREEGVFFLLFFKFSPEVAAAAPGAFTASATKWDAGT